MNNKHLSWYKEIITLLLPLGHISFINFKRFTQGSQMNQTSNLAPQNHGRVNYRQSMGGGD